LDWRCLKEALHTSGHLSDVDSHHRQHEAALLIDELVEGAKLFAARLTPGREEVEEDDPPSLTL
jgi:hypothetical protein